MDFMKKQADRLKQGISETLLDGARTEFDPEFQALLNKADDVKIYTEKLLAAIETIAQPDPAARLLPGFTQEGKNEYETMADHMSNFNKAISVWQPAAPELAAVMKSGDDVFAKMGQAQKEYLANVNKDVIIPMRRFLNEDVKALEGERRTLNTKRLDMDAAKSKVTKEPDNKKFEDELMKASGAFNEQKEKVQGLIEKMQKEHGCVHAHLKKFTTLHSQLLADHHKTIEDYNQRL